MNILSKTSACICVISLAASFSMFGVNHVQAERFQVIELDEAQGKAYLRVDLKTGAMSRCAEDQGVWQCVPFKDTSKDNEKRLKNRISKLEARIEVLEKERESLPDMAELEQAMDMSEQVMRRFFGMVQGLKKDMAQ
ncbi:MAG: hypothetical protein AB8B94_08650 [Hyphomicrobiales bacterium]